MSMSIPDALMMSLMGILIVFAVLLILMGVIYIMTAVSGRKRSAPKEAAAAGIIGGDGPTASWPSSGPPAKGSCGEVSVFSVPDRDVAMIMAIVANQLDAPLNELRFISIREVEDESI